MSELLNRASFYFISRMSVSFIIDLWDSEYARTKLIQVRLFWAYLTIRFIKNNFFKWSCDFLDFSDTEILDITFTDNKSSVEIIILKDIDLIINLTIDLIIKLSVLETLSFIIKFIEMMIKLDKALIENLINSVFLLLYY